MKKRDITATQLAKELNLSVPTFSQWKNGKAKPSYDAIVKIAKYFNISTDYLLCQTDDPTPPGREESEENDEFPDISGLARAAKKMQPADRETIIKLAKYMFPDAFDDDNDKNK